MTELTLVSPIVESHLTKLLGVLNITNYSIKTTPGSIKGDNFLGIIASVQITGEKNGAITKLNLIVKSAPNSYVFRNHFPVRDAYEREIFIYKEVLPEYVKLQEEKCTKDSFTSFAKFYNSTMEDLNEALIMENMKAHDFELANRFEPLNYHQAALVLRNYGKLHALSFAIKDQKPNLFKKFAENTRGCVMTRGSEEHETHMMAQTERALDSLDPVIHEKAYTKFKAFQIHMMDKFRTALNSEEAGQYAIVGHGDCWINNMLFKYGDPEQPTVPTEVCLLDWQLSRLGSPALDLGYFIFTCTDKDLRDEHYQHLIDEYYNTFCSFLRELGSDPEKLFPYKVLQEHLKKFSVYGLFMAVMILYFISSDNDEIPDINSITDMEEAKQKFSYVSKNIEKYRSRIRGVVLDFVKYDYDF